MPTDLIRHYDLLIDENNDPVHDSAPLRAYMDQWDGPVFLEMLALEIGVGTGRRRILHTWAMPICFAAIFWTPN